MLSRNVLIWIETSFSNWNEGERMKLNINKRNKNKIKKAKEWLYLSPEWRLVKPIVQSFFHHRLVHGELILQPLVNGGVPPMKPLGF
jgi:hypothetical protein